MGHVYDLEIIDNISTLFNKKIIIYGTSSSAENLWPLIKGLNLKIVSCFDSDQKKWTKNFHGYQIKNPTENYYEHVDDIHNIIIIICSVYTEEIMDFCDSLLPNDQNWNFVTAFGLRYACLLNRFNDVLDQDFRIWYQKHYERWCHEQRNIFVYQHRMQYLNNLLEFDNSNPILVYQPGKVGSAGIYDSIKETGCNVMHIHQFDPCLNCFTSQESEDLILDFLQAKNDKKKIKIITLIRDPIARDISTIFQALYDPSRYMYNEFSNNFTDNVINCLKSVFMDKTRIEHPDINTPEELWHDGYDHRRKGITGIFFNWFDLELKQFFDIDIFEYPFDKESGYSLIKKNQVECLVLKLENLSKNFHILKDFVDVDNLEEKFTNSAAEKKYKYLYEAVKANIIIPEELLESYYYQNERTKHFYSEKEIEAFQKKWSKRA